MRIKKALGIGSAEAVPKFSQLRPVAEGICRSCVHHYDEGVQVQQDRHRYTAPATPAEVLALPWIRSQVADPEVVPLITESEAWAVPYSNELHHILGVVSTKHCVCCSKQLCDAISQFGIPVDKVHCVTLFIVCLVVLADGQGELNIKGPLNILSSIALLTQLHEEIMLADDQAFAVYRLPIHWRT